MKDREVIEAGEWLFIETCTCIFRPCGTCPPTADGWRVTHCPMEHSEIRHSLFRRVPREAGN